MSAATFCCARAGLGHQRLRSRLDSSITAVLFVCILVGRADAAFAQRQTLVFFGGAAIALGMHEAGHLTLDGAFGASPGFKKVSFGPIPFFAITHHTVSPAREFTISSAGFWVQHAADEILLRSPRLRAADQPLLKGMFAFNVLASVAYAGAAFAQTGPDERDTRGIAVSADVPEPMIGMVILAPAALDSVRYFRPQWTWAKWASRAAKIGGALIVIRAKT
jgi:hypothetical protein